MNPYHIYKVRYTSVSDGQEFENYEKVEAEFINQAVRQIEKLADSRGWAEPKIVSVEMVEK